MTEVFLFFALAASLVSNLWQSARYNIEENDKNLLEIEIFHLKAEIKRLHKRCRDLMKNRGL